MPEMAQIYTGASCKPNRTIPFNVKLLGLYKGLAHKGLSTQTYCKITWIGQFGAMSGPIKVIFDKFC